MPEATELTSHRSTRSATYEIDERTWDILDRERVTRRLRPSPGQLALAVSGARRQGWSAEEVRRFIGGLSETEEAELRSLGALIERMPTLLRHALVESSLRLSDLRVAQERCPEARSFSVAVAGLLANTHSPGGWSDAEA